MKLLYSQTVAIRELAGNKCELCGEKEYINVHHKDRNPHNNHPSNIAVLCAYCHTAEHLPGFQKLKVGDIAEYKVNKPGWDWTLKVVVEGIVHSYGRIRYVVSDALNRKKVILLSKIN